MSNPPDDFAEQLAELREQVTQLQQAQSRLRGTERQLEISESRFRKIFDHSNDAIFVIDPEHDQIVDANTRACTMLGYTRSELLAIPVSAIHPDEMPQLLALARTATQEGHGWTDELSCITKAGARIPAEISASVMELDDKDYMLAIVRDVSDRKQAEEAHRRSEARFRRLVEHAADALFVIDPQGRILDVNQCACDRLGYTREELLKLRVPDFSLTPPERVAELLREVAERGPLTIETKHRRTDASTFPVEVRIGALEEDEKVLRVALARDITERKLAETALRESEERFAKMFQSAMDAIVIVDREHGVRLFNDAAEKVFRCDRDAAVGRSADRFLSADLQKLISSLLGEEGRAGDAEGAIWAPDGTSGVRTDGERFPVEVTLSRFTIGTEPFCTIILRDINDRKRAEAELKRLQREKVYLEEELRTVHNVGEMIATSGAMTALFDNIARVARTDSTVLITGETGTGKELIARAIHDASARDAKVLVKVNCAALPGGLIESELFGHERGAFTGATTRKIGRFELADGGTIFLDEIGELPLELQPKLLRVLQEGEFERVGGTKTIKVDVRVIAATNRKLERAVREERFRSDLFYRLSVVPMHVPPLRERTEDIPVLAEFFVRKYATKTGKRFRALEPATLALLRSYSWPGNVRELENVIERAVVLSSGDTLDVAAALGTGQRSSATPTPLTLDEVQRRHILHVLDVTGWKVSGPGGAAELLGLKHTTLDARMKKLGIRRKKRSPPSSNIS